MLNNKFIISCAGSGKTTQIVKDTLKFSDSILVTTFTDENYEEIKRKYYEINGFIPSNVKILPWFTFEIRHLIKPFLLPLIKTDIKGIHLVPNQSALRFCKCSQDYYLDNNNKIYSDKIALLAYKSICEKEYEVLSRLKRLFSRIYIDEFQDFAGYDLDIVKKLMQNKFNIMLVGDPRQKTFATHFSRKNKKYRDDVESFIRNECKEYCNIDLTTLNNSFRCPESIISYASKLFPEYPLSHSNSTEKEGDGIYFVIRKDINKFLSREESTIQLRIDSKIKIDNASKVMTFGKSKGSTFENVLIYPTKNIKKAILSNDFNLINSKQTRCKFYVALTRAKHKVGIVIEESDLNGYNIGSIALWPS